MKLKFWTFTVTGFGDFPFDMLRYDRCSPLTSDDARSIANASKHAKPQIRLVSHLKSPTEGRWQSFGWSVSNIKMDRMEI